MNLSKIILGLLILIFTIFSFNNVSAINLTISPIKYELNSHTWWTITKETKLTNNTSGTLYITTWKSDFISNWGNWRPLFIRKSEVVFDQELSDWITIDTPSFNIAPWETKTVNFTINVPNNATPGWHYWAVFFKNDNSERSSGVNVWINVDYWILILLNIDWDINSEIEILTPIINIWWGWSTNKKMDVCNNTSWDKSWDYYDWICSKDWKTLSETWSLAENNKELLEDNKEIETLFKKDDCLVDLTSSNFDWKCINNVEEIVSEIIWNTKNIEIETGEDDKFEIKIEIPIENTWNTHVKPKWKVTLIDEDWNEIKRVWKEIIINDAWAIIWEKIVNYIPINDIWWNILPWTKRNYKSDWKWFPYEVYNENWVKEIKYWTPTEYYTRQNMEEKTFIMPWERMSTKVNNKTIKAVFDINYKDENWEDIEYNSAKEFDVEYTERYVWLNPYFFIWFWFLWLIILLLMLIFRKKKRICINKDCAKKIDKDLKICPYCETKQEKLKKKKWDKKIKKKEKLKKDKKEPTIIVPLKKQKLKTKDLDLQEKIKNILIKNKLKYADDLVKLSKTEVLEIKWIWEKALGEIKKALKKEKMKLKK